MPDQVELLTLSNDNKPAFLKSLREELYRKFGTDNDESLPENYANSKPWSLLSMIENNLLDTYQLVYVEKVFWGASGGIVRPTPEDIKIYQAGFRTFTHALPIYKGLGMKPYVTALCIRHQIERARELDCDKIVLSFNSQNRRLFELVSKYHHQRSFLGVAELMRDFVPRSEPMMFNGVLQWLLEMTLK